MHPGDDDVYAGTDIAPYEMTPVERWRCNAFLNAGFDPHAAERLALSNADVHKTIRALGNGCSLELALEIFL